MSRLRKPLWSVFIISCSLAALFQACNDSGTRGNEISKAEVEKAKGKSDVWGSICFELSQQSTCDICETLKWYSDGVCDDFCPKPDPDCKAASSTKTVFDFTGSAMPEGVATFFVDYPVSEDEDAKSAERKQCLQDALADYRTKNGHDPLTYYENGLELELLCQGLYLNSFLGAVDAAKKMVGLVFTQINRPDDLDTHTVLSLSKLKPNSQYAVGLEISLWSNACKGGMGVGGAPDGVALKATACSKPFSRMKTTEEVPYWRLSTSSCKENEPFDNISSGIDCGSPDEAKYTKATYTTELKSPAKTSAKGELHVDLSTHSGYESLSVWAYERITVTLTEVP
jgi:hypothetical protein